MRTDGQRHELRLSDFNETRIFLDRFSKNIQSMDGQTDRDTTEVIIAFRNFANEPKSVDTY